MSTELATRTAGVQITTMDELARVADMFAKSGLFRDTADAAQAGVKILAGQAWGIDAFSSMVGIALIQGKPVIGAGIMAAKVKGHPKYDFIVKRLDETACEIEFFQGERSLGVSSFTIEDAKQAGYASKQNYRQTPRNMLFARALSNGVRWYTPDVFSSSVYTPEDFNQEGEVSVEVVPTPQPEKPQERPQATEPTPVPEPEPEGPQEAAEPAGDGPLAITKDQRVAVNRELKREDVGKDDAIAFFRWFTGRDDISGSADLTAREATSFLSMVARDEFADKLAAFADHTAFAAEDAA